MALDEPIPLTDLGVPQVSADPRQSIQQDGGIQRHPAECDSDTRSLQAVDIRRQEPTSSAVKPNRAHPGPPCPTDIPRQGVVSDKAEAGDCGLSSSQADSDELFQRFQLTKQLRLILEAWIVVLSPVIDGLTANRGPVNFEDDTLRREWVLSLMEESEEVAARAAREFGKTYGVVPIGDQGLRDFHSTLGQVKTYADQVQQTSRILSALVRRCGVRMPEKPWSRNQLAVLFFLCVFAGSQSLPPLCRIWVTCAANAFQHSIIWNGVVTPSVALFDGEQRRNAAFVVADFVTVVSCLAMAIASEFLNRAQGLAMALGFATLGLVLFAVTQNMATLSAGQVFYGIGFTGIRLIVEILVSDITNFRDRALAYAFVYTPWALTAFSVPAFRRDSQSSEMRPAIAAFAGLIPVLGGLLSGFLQRYKAHNPRPKQLKSVIRRLRGPKISLNSDKFIASRRSLSKFLRFGLPLSTFGLLLFLLSLFVILWLVQMEVIPWFAILPPAVLLGGLTAFLFALKSPGFNGRVYVWLVKSAKTSWVDWRIARHHRAWLMSLAGRIAGKTDSAVQFFRQEDSVLRPIQGRTMLATCALCLLWKRE